jgi:hypothetical protein
MQSTRQGEKPILIEPRRRGKGVLKSGKWKLEDS